MEKSVLTYNGLNEINLDTSKLHEGKYMVLIYQNNELVFVPKQYISKGLSYLTLDILCDNIRLF